MKKMNQKGKATESLKLISSEESLVLDEADGKRIISDAEKVFIWIDPSFENWGVDERGVKTPETKVYVYKLIKDATFEQMFSSFSSDPRKLCFTQDQVIGFVEKHRSWFLENNYLAFFLFESNSELFVAYVGAYPGGLGVSVCRFEPSRVWRAGHQRRIVIPQLA